ncbi:hypothetical protein BDB00DRAFT_852322 [Zychaea mexicana]|uniref:uncharacterized protein n=1 Tax=Zychaea mexicana TaxID=64656 RepID=UPI0022FF0592|nr:uncharacterized protein BDB00DRAFT_852322 [Zychaea mexicana]KAI9484946.1 hypothetical protein BDB00DRAFT_852322 [Zychaea mexicana]
MKARSAPFFNVLLLRKLFLPEVLSFVSIDMSSLSDKPMISDLSVYPVEPLLCLVYRKSRNSILFSMMPSCLVGYVSVLHNVNLLP